MISMFVFVCIGWMFFRAPSGDLLPLFASLATWPPFSLRLLLLGAVVIATDFIGYRNGAEFVDIYAATPWWMRSLLFVGVFYGIVFFGTREQNAFIYFQF